MAAGGVTLACSPMPLASYGPGPYEAKGIGEHANVTPPAAIANAVQDACGVRIFDTPVTAEKVYAALHGKA